MPGKRLSLDPIDHSPLGHPMKFTQRSFPFYRLGLHQVLPLLIRQFRNWLGSFLGWGSYYIYVLKLFQFHPANPQWCSGYRSLLDYLGRGFVSCYLSYQFFFFQIEENCAFMTIPA